jgi:two-component system OmpR family sensor kinase
MVAVFDSRGDGSRLLAGGFFDEHEGVAHIFPRDPLLTLRAKLAPLDRTARNPAAAAAPGAPFPMAPAPGPPFGPGRLDRIPPYPFGLNLFLHIEPRIVDIPGGRIRIVADPRGLSGTIDSFWAAMLPLGIFVAIAAWFLGRYITGQALRPLVETTAALNRFAAGDFTPREIVASGRNEIAELVTAYNGAVAQVNAAFEERKDVEQRMRHFVADAGHELRTPLTVIMGFIDVLRRRATHDAGTSTKIFDTILAESRRMRSLIDRLIALARLDNAQTTSALERVDLARVAADVVTAMQTLQPRARISLRAEPGVVVLANELELHEAVSNLVDNAIKYAPLAPVDVVVREENESAVVEVTDRGPGISLENRERIFDRFYRGDNRGETEGHGLGLAIVKRVVERAGGELVLEQPPGGGCRFTIRLPRAHGEDAAIAV